MKGTADDARKTVETERVRRYLEHYRQVLVTNLRDLVLVGMGDGDQPKILETYRLADDERAFWRATAQPERTAKQHGDRFMEYLKRVMFHRAPLADPKGPGLVPGVVRS